MTISTAASSIERRDFVDWRGLPSAGSPEALFGLRRDTAWGEFQLGAEFCPAKSQLLTMEGYYRPTVYARGDAVVLFDGMNPDLEPGWDRLERDLGTPDHALTWTYDGMELPDSELVFAGRGITLFVNPDNRFVVYVSLYEATSVDHYVNYLRITRRRPRQRSTS